MNNSTIIDSGFEKTLARLDFIHKGGVTSIEKMGGLSRIVIKRAGDLSDDDRKKLMFIHMHSRQTGVVVDYDHDAETGSIAIV